MQMDMMLYEIAFESSKLKGAINQQVA